MGNTAEAEGGAITTLLRAWHEGDPRAFDALIPLVFDDLRRLARHYFGREAPGSTLQPTAVVHEVYLRLLGQKLVRIESRSHFFGIASRLIRQVLIDHARIRCAGKRGAGVAAEPLSDRLPARDSSLGIETLLSVHQALDSLEARDERKARLVELRYFCGLTLPEAADVLGISRATAERDWTFSRRWLAREIAGVE